MSLTASIHPHEPSRTRLAGIILAAGASSRMGRCKPLLRLAGMTVLERNIALLRDAGADEVLVVIGNHAEELQPLAKQCGARCVHNANCSGRLRAPSRCPPRAVCDCSATGCRLRHFS
jgi:2-C-methyl-D-erythritol 4-phosphate cytidylyltransferase